MLDISDRFRTFLTTDPRLDVMVEREHTYYHGQSALVYALITGLGTISMIMNGGPMLASGLGHRVHQAGSMGKLAAAERKVPGAKGGAGAGAATQATGGVAAGAAAAHAVLLQVTKGPK